MKQELVKSPIGELEIRQRIKTIRCVQVMLDRDLAELYGVTTGQLNRQVKRNIKRFPSDFMFQLTKEDCLRCQIGILNGKRGEHLKFMPYAFTENGIAMLSGVLRSDTAIEVNIQIMRAFNAMRHTHASIAGVLQRLGTVEVKQVEADKKFDTIFDALDRTKLSSPYGIYVNPYSGYIYATDANGDFNSPGRLHQWTPTGEYINNYKIYINPAHFLALGNWVSEAVDDITCPAIRNARSFNLQGIAVGQGGKGVIISGGKKYLRK